MFRSNPHERTPLLDIRRIRDEADLEDPLHDAIVKLAEIEVNQRRKFIPAHIGYSLILATTGAFIYAMVRLSKLPGLRPPRQIPPDFTLNYNNVTIASLNSTCGAQYPLVDVCDFSQYTHSFDWRCSTIASSICEAQKMVAAFSSEMVRVEAGHRYTCADIYPTDNFCTWPSIMGDGYTCAQIARDLCLGVGSDSSTSYSRSTSYGSGSHYVNVLETYFNTRISSAPDATCGYILPLADVCDWGEFKETVAYQCGSLANNICSTYYPLVDQYKTILTNATSSCFNSYPLNDYCDWKSIVSHSYNCSVAAANQCTNKNNWRDPHDDYAGPEFWSTGRIWFLGIAIAALLIVLIVSVILIRVTCALEPLTKVSDLPNNDQDEFRRLANKTNVDVNNTTSIIRSLKRFEVKHDTIVHNREMLRKVQSTLLSAMMEKNDKSPLHSLLKVKDVARIIFKYAGLFLPKVKPEMPVENDDKKALMQV